MSARSVPVLRATILLTVLGALVGTACDRMHLFTQTLLYAEPTPMEQPWWVAPLFGGAGFGFGIGRIIIARFKTHAPTFEQAMAATALFLMAYIASSVLGDSFALLVISGLAIATLLRYDSSKLGYLHAGLSAVAGSIVEIVLIDAGLFHYTDSEGALFVLGIPLWLPMLYVCGATSAGCFARYFSQP